MFSKSTARDNYLLRLGLRLFSNAQNVEVDFLISAVLGVEHFDSRPASIGNGNLVITRQ